MEEKPSRIFKVVRGLVKWTLIVAAVFALLYGLLGLLGSRREKAARARWAQSVGSLEEFQRALPETKRNAEAQALEALVATLGLGPDEAKSPWKEVRGPLYDYVKAQLEKTTAEADAPPEAVSTFLAKERETVASLRRQLVDGATPIWEEHRTNLYAAPMPRLMVIIGLQRLFAADALAALQRGERDEAAVDLEASWKLQEALSHRPELISALIRIALVRLSAGVLRKFDGAPAVWTERLASYDPRTDLLNGYKYEACALLEVGHPGPAEAAYFEGSSLWGHIPTRLARTYLHLCAASSADILLDLLESVRNEDPCVQDLQDKLAPIVKKAPWWNIVGRIAIPNLGVWARAGRIQVEVELTRKILEARAARDKNGGSWPPSLPGIEASVCKGEKWTYTLSPDRLTIAFSKDFPPPSAQSSMLPLRHEEAVLTAPRKGR